MMEQKVGDAHMLAAGTNRRNYQMDNLKCLLIFSVVFGHMLELFMGKNSPERVIYLVIYSFHMPLFAFVSGVFARYNPSKIKNNMIYPYLIFQTLYLLFSNQILDKDADMQYTTPYWLLWYLFAIIVWNLVLPLVQVEGMKKKMAMLLAAAAASVFIGFDEKAGYFLSASRIVEFFPYFLLGVYYRDMKRLSLIHIFLSIINKMKEDGLIDKDVVDKVTLDFDEIMEITRNRCQPILDMYHRIQSEYLQIEGYMAGISQADIGQAGISEDISEKGNG